jgi:restriction system protein
VTSNLQSRTQSRSVQLGAKLILLAFQFLKERGGEAAGREVIAEVGKRADFLDSWALETYVKTGLIRWQSTMLFCTIDCAKAGYMRKHKGVWYLTEDGEEAMKLGAAAMMDAAIEKYRAWKDSNTPTLEKSNTTDVQDDADIDVREVDLDQIQQTANEGLKHQINAKNPYEFQDLTAALLRGMGYFTPFVAPKGKDGGVDIIAYRDPLGTVSPRIKVQVKHRESSANVQELRQLMGLLQNNGDVGLFVSTGGFTPDAKQTSRSSHVHVELVDLDRFIILWQEFYPKLSDEDKNLLPLQPIYFYSPPV